MKKIIVLLSIMFIFSVCSRDYESEFEIVYDVYYPTETYTITEKIKGGEDAWYYTSSRKGTNYLYFSRSLFSRDVILYLGTAPFRVVSCKKIK